MHFTPREQEKLLVFLAAQLARQRQARGLKLNYPEAVAILTHEIVEGARDGRSVAELMSHGRHILGPDDVMPGVAAMIHEVQVEATFPDGTKLVTIYESIPRDGIEVPRLVIGRGVCAGFRRCACSPPGRRSFAKRSSRRLPRHSRPGKVFPVHKTFGETGLRGYRSAFTRYTYIAIV